MKLKWWMRAVGGFYVLVGLFNLPPVIEARFSAQYPDLGVPVQSAAAQALIDVWFMFGLEVLVLGAALLYFARHARRHVALAWTVIALELVRGVADDVYLLLRGYDPVLYGGWIALHLVIIVAGVWAVRGSGREQAAAGAAGARVP